MSPYYQQPQGLSRRSLAAGGIVALHVLILYALATGLGTHALNILAEPMKASVLDVDKTRPPAEPPPGPRLVQPRIEDFVPPDIVINEPPQTVDSIIIDRTPPAPPSPPVVRNPDPIRLVGQNRLPNSEDYYPSELRREGVQGAAVVRVCVDERGVRQGNPVVEQSSGNARLDEGALNVARSGRYA
jgi:protein TonB